jgi:hypothetical protein
MFEIFILTIAFITFIITIAIKYRHWIYDRIEESLLAQIKADPINNYADFYRAIKVYKHLLRKLDDYFL